MKTLNLIYPKFRFYTLLSSVFFPTAPTGLFQNLPYLLLYTLRSPFIPRVTHPTHLPPHFLPLYLHSSDSYLNVLPTTAFHHRHKTPNHRSFSFYSLSSCSISILQDGAGTRPHCRSSGEASRWTAPTKASVRDVLGRRRRLCEGRRWTGQGPPEGEIGVPLGGGRVAGRPWGAQADSGVSGMYC